VRDLAADGEERLGFPPRLRFSGPVDTVVDRDRREQLLAVLRESLSNVIRRAAASTIDIEVTAGHELVLRVSDDGQGASSDWGRVQPEERGLAGRRTRRVLRPGDQYAPGTILQWRVPRAAGGLPRRNLIVAP